jgi:glutathione S-transferase
MTTCNEIGVKVEIVPVDLQKGEHKTEEYLSTRHPFGVIPVLEVCSPSIIVTWAPRFNTL